ncbi:hypothetical protein JHK87_050272 [Glycine soja]|nr:hypothetical protein JHK87_050272 [Glycine soja]
MVRVVHLWMGDRVHGSVKQTFIYKFDKALQEGKWYSIQFFGVAENGGIYRTNHHKYKIVFQYSTKVALVDNASIPNSMYDFVPIRDIVCGGYDTDYLVVMFNVECEEVKELATRMLESPSQGLSQLIDSTELRMSEDFLHNTPWQTIGALKDCFEDTCFAVFGTVKHVVDDEEWWYCIKVRVIDESDSATFVIFDRDATILFSKSCANMFETYKKRGLAETFPREIINLVDRSFLFKVEPENMEVADKKLEGGEFENVKTNENSRLKGKTDAVGMDVEPM